MYTIKLHSTTVLRAPYGSRKYTVGFPNANIARRVLHEVHSESEPKLLIVPHPQISILHAQSCETTVVIDSRATLFVSKYCRETNSDNQSHSGRCHLETQREHDYFNIMYQKHGGILIAHEILDEDDSELMIRCHMLHAIL